ncbi:hypothetical protein PENANT_c203G11614, partial [Penicillium antarcticum]
IPIRQTSLWRNPTADHFDHQPPPGSTIGHRFNNRIEINQQLDCLDERGLTD